MPVYVQHLIKKYECQGEGWGMVKHYLSDFIVVSDLIDFIQCY